MDYIPLDCPLEHSAHNIKSPQIAEVESGVVVSIRLKCPHKHKHETTGWIQFDIDTFGCVSWKECGKEDKTFHAERPIRSQGIPE